MMRIGGTYRVTSVAGVVGITALAVVATNNATAQTIAAAVPIISNLSAEPPTGSELIVEVLLTAVIVAGACFPLYKPRPRRILDTIALTHKRILVAMFALATIGYFDYTYRLPRLTLLLVTPILFVILPLWFIWLRKQPRSDHEQAIIVGDDREVIKDVAADVDTDINIMGCLCPNPLAETAAAEARAVADGGNHTDIDRLGGLSRIEDVLVNYDIDTAVLAFPKADRAEFFGALDACYEHGVSAKIHHAHADTVLTAESDGKAFVDIDIEPWDVQDYMLKRGFDVIFAITGLVVLSPVMVLIAIAIKLEDGGSILYQQERTALFGETFKVSKFRSMVENAETETGATISDEDDGGVDPRVTRVGRVLRQTHLDEIPQLWSVLRGDMSAVGPRPERPELEHNITASVGEWQKRWFVKPGLTGPAQVNDVTGTEPEQKIRYDLLYVREQSFDYDMKLVVRQIWKILNDASRMILSALSG